MGKAEGWQDFPGRHPAWENIEFLKNGPRMGEQFLRIRHQPNQTDQAGKYQDLGQIPLPGEGESGGIELYAGEPKRRPDRSRL